MTVPAIIRYSRDFVTAASGAIAAVVAAVTDPLKWPQAFGFMTDVHCTTAPPTPQAIFATVAVTWMFVWYARVRHRYEATRPARPNIPLHEAVRYIVGESKWAAMQRPDEDEIWVSNVSRQL